jgi:ribosomal protein S18 acetylase RimI-like enzyme
MMSQMPIVLRAATPVDPADGLLYASSQPYYDAYAGSEARARALLAAVYPRPGHAASYAVCTVAELDGRIAGVLAAYPVVEADRLSRRFVSLTAPRVPPWGWPRLLRHLRAAAQVSPRPPQDALYVDALAVAPEFRRRGVARALLARAEAAAAGAGLAGVALDTGLHNEPARALYEDAGYERREIRRAPSEAIADAIGGPGFVGYLKTVASAPATRAPWPSVSSGKNGSAIERAATSSQTGNSPGRWPKRSR